MTGKTDTDFKEKFTKEGVEYLILDTYQRVKDGQYYMVIDKNEPLPATPKIIYKAD